ncbi:carbon storage regulator [Reticulibacter mediterranei]|nr:carbon storage regulator [Reticulibacter mediterranei]
MARLAASLLCWKRHSRCETWVITARFCSWKATEEAIKPAYLAVERDEGMSCRVDRYVYRMRIAGFSRLRAIERTQMLVLRRKVGESIVLAGVINITVLAVEGERVKIGISAPPDVSIVREELLKGGSREESEEKVPK